MLRCMGGTNPHLPPRALALGTALREAREAAGYTVRGLAKQLAWSHATISRYETGDRYPRMEDVAAILATLGVNGPKRDELLDLARETPRRQWLSIGMTEQQQQLATLLDLEAQASAITSVSPLLIPGLLQTGDYARAIMRAGEVPPEEVETRVNVRLGRRDALTRPQPTMLTAVVGEGALQQIIGGPDIMLAQLKHLASVVDLPTVDFRVIPTRCRWNPALEGPFVLVQFDDSGPVVHIENRRSGLFLHEEEDVDAYLKAVDMVLREAMSPGESAEVIAREAELIERIK